MNETPRTLCFIQEGGGHSGDEESDIEEDYFGFAKSFASSLHLENPTNLYLCVIDFHPSIQDNQRWNIMLQECKSDSFLTIAGYDQELVRRIPLITLSERNNYKRRNIIWRQVSIYMLGVVIVFREM